MNNFKVVKFGSELIADQNGINHEMIEFYVRGLASEQTGGLIVVTSGAVAAGAAREARRGKDILTYKDSTLAQLGCASVMSAWERAFDTVGISAGGLLVTHNELESSAGAAFVDNLKDAADKGIVSIINENDALSNKELMELACGGDNDGLAGHIARAIGARTLTLFTKNGGIFDDDGVLIRSIDSTNVLDVQNMLVARSVVQKSRGGGRGGIVKKFQAASASAAAGVKTKIAAVNTGMNGDRVTEFMVG